MPERTAFDLAANYNLGALALGAGYSYVNSNYQLGLRAAYTFGQFTVGGYYQRNKDDNQLVRSAPGPATTSAWSGMYTMGASEFHVNLGHANKGTTWLTAPPRSKSPGLQLQPEQAHQGVRLLHLREQQRRSAST